MKGWAINQLKDFQGGPARVRVHTTTDSPDSSYGIPVWVDSKGRSYGQVGLQVLGWTIIADEDGMKDGWHTISGDELYIEGGLVLRGIKTDSNGGRVTAYPYRKNPKGGWDKDTNITPAAYKAGARRGTIALK